MIGGESSEAPDKSRGARGNQSEIEDNSHKYAGYLRGCASKTRGAPGRKPENAWNVSTKCSIKREEQTMRVQILRITVYSILLYCANLACAPTLSSDDYNTSCEKDEDCVVIPAGNVCDCTEPKGSVNVNEKDKYYSDYNELRSTCIAIVNDCAYDEDTTAICANKSCRAWRPQ